MSMIQAASVGIGQGCQQMIPKMNLGPLGMHLRNTNEKVARGDSDLFRSYCGLGCFFGGVMLRIKIHAIPSCIYVVKDDSCNFLSVFRSDF